MADSFSSNFDIGDWDYFGDYDDGDGSDQDQDQLVRTAGQSATATTSKSSNQTTTATLAAASTSAAAAKSTSAAPTSTESNLTQVKLEPGTETQVQVKLESGIKFKLEPGIQIKVEPGTTTTTTDSASSSNSNVSSSSPSGVKNSSSSTTSSTSAIPTATVTPQPSVSTSRLRSVPLTPTILRITSTAAPPPIGQGGSSSGNMIPGSTSASASAGNASPPGGAQEVPDLMAMDWSPGPNPGQGTSSASASFSSAAASSPSFSNLSTAQRIRATCQAQFLTQVQQQPAVQQHQQQQSAPPSVPLSLQQQRDLQRQQHQQAWHQQHQAWANRQQTFTFQPVQRTQSGNPSSSANANATVTSTTGAATAATPQIMNPNNQQQQQQQGQPQATYYLPRIYYPPTSTVNSHNVTQGQGTQPLSFGSFGIAAAPLPQPTPMQWGGMGSAHPVTLNQPTNQNPSAVTMAMAPTHTLLPSSAMPASLYQAGFRSAPPPSSTSTVPGPGPMLPTTYYPIHSTHGGRTLGSHFQYLGYNPHQHKHNSASGFTPMCSWIPPFPITPECPCPPGWDVSLDAAMQVYTPYHKIHVEGSSKEYKVLTSLIGSSCLGITKIERVVNNELWNRFVKERKEILAAKTEADDTTLLNALGLSDKEIAQRIQRASNFDKDPTLGPYSDNTALLFHCTRGDIESVLTQGLDERLGNVGGLLGKGIYFADDPKKSMTYDSTAGLLMIFAVYLGDCYNVNHSHIKKHLVREPEKTGRQRRNQTDLFFDSIVGRHSTGNGEFNEYVIYNRKQCCPLYLVSYQKYMNVLQERPQPSDSTRNEDVYQQARLKTPPFGWTSADPVREPDWPFLAKNIFDLMEEGVDGTDHGLASAIGETRVRIPHQRSRSPLPEIPLLDDTDTDTAMKLSAILGLGIEGYMDDTSNIRLLRRFRYNLEQTIDHILQESSSRGAAAASTSATTATATASGSRSRDQVTEDNLSSIISKTGAMGGFPQLAKSKSRERDSSGGRSDEPSALTKKFKSEPKDRDQDEKDESDSDARNYFSSSSSSSSSPSPSPKEEKNEDCLICCTDYPSGTSYWKVLPCTHKLCIPCHGQLESKGVTMSGVEHVYLKCPFCQSCSGKEVGSCPNGSMTVTQAPYDCAGYEGYGSLCINYDIHRTAVSKYSLNRTAYLPNSPKGNNVLSLLKLAFDRRLIFSIGTSMTTGRTDTLVWNIHHKTGLVGGAQAHAYPDPTYLDRVLDELKQYGLQLQDQIVPSMAIKTEKK